MYQKYWRISKKVKMPSSETYEKELSVSFYSTLVTSSELTLASSFQKRPCI